MADGWIKIWRKIADSPMWLEEPFTKGQAWIDLLLLATASDHVSRYKGRNKTYKSGTVHFSLRYLATRWGWSRNKVYRFIEKLQKDGMVEYQGRTGNGTIDGTINDTTNDTTNDTINGTINGTTFDTSLTIVKWALYQVGGRKNGTTNDTTDGTTNGTTNGTTDGTRNRTGNGTHPKKDIYPKNDISKEEKKRKKKSASPSPFPPDGGGDVPKASRMKPKDEGTVDDIPAEVRDMFETYKDYWEFRNR